MEKVLNDYLEKIEKCLRPLPVSERVDIVKEIQSEMFDLQSGGKTPAWAASPPPCTSCG